jgi:hypothetical protein
MMKRASFARLPGRGRPGLRGCRGVRHCFGLRESRLRLFGWAPVAASADEVIQRWSAVKAVRAKQRPLAKRSRAEDGVQNRGPSALPTVLCFGDLEQG